MEVSIRASRPRGSLGRCQFMLLRSLLLSISLTNPASLYFPFTSWYHDHDRTVGTAARLFVA